MSDKPKNARDPHGDPEGTVFDPNALNVSAATLTLVKNAADVLEKQYPGWLWAIQPDERGGIINIFASRLSLQWGYTLKTETVQADPRMRRVVRAAGELIERFGYRPGPFRLDTFNAGKRHLGLPTADVSDLSKRAQRDYRTSSLQDAVSSGRARILMDADVARAKAITR